MSKITQAQRNSLNRKPSSKSFLYLLRVYFKTPDFQFSFIILGFVLYIKYYFILSSFLLYFIPIFLGILVFVISVKNFATIKLPYFLKKKRRTKIRTYSKDIERIERVRKAKTRSLYDSPPTHPKIREIVNQGELSIKHDLEVKDTFFENSKRYKAIPRFIPPYKSSELFKDLSQEKNCLTCRYSDIFFTPRRMIINCKKRSNNGFYIFKFWSRPCWNPDGEWLHNLKMGNLKNREVELKNKFKILL